MMEIWIDVEAINGTRYGDGPIVTATGWESVRRLDGAGTFVFAMPAGDPRSALLAHKRIVRCWGADGDGVREVGAGIIEQIELMPGRPGQATMLRVSGDDLLRELANRTVGELALWQEVDYTPTVRIEEVYADPDSNTGYDLTLPESVNLSASEPLKLLYIQYSRPFSKITLTLSSVNTVETDTFQVQYYNAEDVLRPAWESLGQLVNNSAAGPDPGETAITPFGVVGTQTIEFAAPAGWRPLGGQYIVRMFDQAADLEAFGLTAVSVTIVEPVEDGLQRIMALAPPGWSLDPAGSYATAGPVYMQYNGETVLAALARLAEHTGEHFRLAPAGRRITWIGVDQDDSGLQAVASGSLDTDGRLLITDLRRTSDSYELYTRLYAYGGGVGSGRLTMALATASEAGYTLGADGTYLDADAAQASYGRIDRREDYPEVAPLDVSEAQQIHAANALYWRVYHALRRHSQLQYAFELSVMPGRYTIWPGQTIAVRYQEWRDGYAVVDIDATLWVLEVQQRVGVEGVMVAALTVSTVDYAPNNDYSTVARLMGSVQTQRSQDLPASGYSSVDAGVPVQLSVNNGQVTSVRRVRPAADGWYDLSNYTMMRIEGGVVAALVAP
jgi:hypothetical protein